MLLIIVGGYVEVVVSIRLLVVKAEWLISLGMHKKNRLDRGGSITSFIKITLQTQKLTPTIVLTAVDSCRFVNTRVTVQPLDHPGTDTSPLLLSYHGRALNAASKNLSPVLLALAGFAYN